MEPEEIYGAMLDALKEHSRLQLEEASNVSGGMLPIAPFEAETDSDERVTAIGIITNPNQDVLDFVVLKELDGGEIIPTTESSLWRVKPTAITQ